jgi:hypothetical protein
MKCLALFAVPESIEASAAGLETKLERLMAAKGSSFEKEVAYRASQAAGMVWYESCCGLPPVHLPHLLSLADASLISNCSYASTVISQ